MGSLTDPYFLGRPEMHATFRRLRSQAPIAWHPLGDDGFWVVSRHRDVVAISNDPLTFSSARGGTSLYDQPPGQEGALLFMDPPEHRQMRASVSGFFSGDAVNKLEPWMRSECRALVTRALDQGAVDFVYDVAADLPLNTIGELLGISAVERRHLLTLADELFASAAGRGDRMVKAMNDLGAFGLDLARERRTRPGVDLISAMLRGGTGGRPLSDQEFGGMFMQITGAATETTRSVLTQIVLFLAERKDLLRDLDRSPQRIRLFIEECLRWTPPVYYMRRTATRDIKMGDVTIRDGDKVAMYYVSANFDEEVFPQSECFIPDRHPNPHLTFGIGEHICLGLKMARLELRVFLEEFVARVGGIDVVGEPVIARTTSSAFYKRVPVRLTPA
jgi:cytochrome P450